MDTSGKFIIARQDATILKAARDLCSMYNDKFSKAAGRQETKSDVYLFAKTAQSFSAAETLLREALATARILAEQDALTDD